LILAVNRGQVRRKTFLKPNEMLNLPQFARRLCDGIGLGMCRRPKIFGERYRIVTVA
jgi:hypothetical protein